MFYKNSSRSTVLERIEAHRNDHANPAEDDSFIDAPLLDCNPPPAKPIKAKLSAFEKELLQAWAQD